MLIYEINFYIIFQSLKVKGNVTLAENLADNGGLKASFMVRQFLVFFSKKNLRG